MPDSSNPYSAFTTSALIPFYPDPQNSPPNAPFTEKIRINVKISSNSGSRLWHPYIDSGTCGYVVSKDSFPGPVPANSPVGWEYLSSSRILYSGHWVMADVLYPDAYSEVRARFPILVVSEKSVYPRFEEGEERSAPISIVKDPEGISVFGVGFGRQFDGQPQGNPDKNPFLNIVSIGRVKIGSDGSFRAGYIIGKEGVTIGLTEESTAGMAFTKLQPGSNHALHPMDWAAVSACIGVNDIPCVEGTALIDTGISHAYLTLPLGSPVQLQNETSPSTGCLVKVLRSGSTMEIRIDSTLPHAASNSFIVGDPEGNERGSVPDMVITKLLDSKSPFINTGRYFLRRWTVAFDAVGGQLGFRPVNTRSETISSGETNDLSVLTDDERLKEKRRG